MPDATELKELADRLREAAHAYYDTDELVMSDAEYDSGIEQLRIAVAEDSALAGEFTDLLDQVAAGQSAGGDVDHPSLMGSMDKVPSLDAVREFVAKVDGPVVVEPKLDGLAIRAVYDNGRLTLVATRGDGRTGEDITQRARTLKILPTNLRGTTLAGESFEVRGEVFMLDGDFPAANKARQAAGGKEFVNTRNAAAGILRKGDAVYANLLKFAAYGAIGLGDGDHGEIMRRVADAGILSSHSMSERAKISTDVLTSTEEVLENIATLGENRETLGFPIDGAVVKAVSSKDRERLGEGSRAPRWAVAFKYEAEQGVSKIVGITTDVGRTGRLALRIELEPVFVGGTTITYASGHNVSWMQEKDIRVGDTVVVRRANDVIPYVAEVLLEDRPDDAVAWEPPENCPRCGEDFNKSTLLWRCESFECSALNRITYACGRDCLDIEFLGVEIATALVEDGLVEDVADLFELTHEQLAKLKLGSGRIVGDKVATKIVDELERAKSADWNRVITALGIRATGRTMGRRLAAAFPTMDRLRATTVSDLANVDGIATKKAEVIREGLDDLENRGILARLEAAGMNMGSEPDGTDTSSAALAGEKVVVTGKVPGLSRTEVQEKIEALGGHASGSVSSATTLLVAEAGSTSSKVKKAQSLGIRVITSEEFLEL